MSKWLLLWLLPGVVPGLAETRELPSASPIALYTRFQRPASTRIVEAMQDELETVMAPLGLDFSWRELDPQRGGEVVAELAVVTFRGQCTTDGLMATEGTTGALGWTHISDGAILSVSAPRISSTTRSGRSKKPTLHFGMVFSARARV